MSGRVPFLYLLAKFGAGLTTGGNASRNRCCLFLVIFSRCVPSMGIDEDAELRLQLHWLHEGRLCPHPLSETFTINMNDESASSAAQKAERSISSEMWSIENMVPPVSSARMLAILSTAVCLLAQHAQNCGWEHGCDGYE